MAPGVVLSDESTSGLLEQSFELVDTRVNKLLSGRASMPSSTQPAQLARRGQLVFSLDVNPARRPNSAGVPTALVSVRSLRPRPPFSANGSHGDTGGAGRPRDLDTLRAWAVAAGDVRSAFLLVGIRAGSSTEVKEPITLPNKEKNDGDHPELIDRFTNALQSALVLTARLEPNLQQAARDAAQLVEAVSKAASAAHELRPDASKRG